MCLANSALMDEKDIPILTGIANCDDWFVAMISFCLTVCMMYLSTCMLACPT